MNVGERVRLLAIKNVQNSALLSDYLQGMGVALENREKRNLRDGVAWTATQPR